MTEQDARLLLRRYLAGNCTTEEKKLVESWFADLQEEFPGEILPEQAAAVHDRVLSNIRSRLSQGLAVRSRPLPVRVPGWRGIAGKAAAVLLIAAGGWVWWAERHTKPVNSPGVSTIDVRPGSNRALLTLGSGQVVMLDSAANGTVAIQGNGQIIKQNGQLDYRMKETSKNKEVVEKPVVFNTLTTPRGGQYRLILPDGTRVWLDAASSITYPTAFTARKRQVSVTGQVYFEVVHDHKMPFEVKVRGQTIRDIGTAFNINAYPEEPVMRTTLTGGVAAVNIEGHEIVLSQPGQQAEYDDGQLRAGGVADLRSVLAWKDGLFHLTSADIATVMRQIGRWYDVDILYEKGIPAGHISGELPRSSALQTVLQILQASGVHFTVEGKKIFVTP